MKNPGYAMKRRTDFDNVLMTHSDDMGVRADSVCILQSAITSRKKIASSVDPPTEARS